MSAFVYYEATVVVEIGDDGRAKCPSLMLNGDATPTIVLNDGSAPGGLYEIDNQHPEWDRLFDTALEKVPETDYDLSPVFGADIGLSPSEYPPYHMDDPRSHG